MQTNHLRDIGHSSLHEKTKGRPLCPAARSLLYFQIKFTIKALWLLNGCVYEASHKAMALLPCQTGPVMSPQKSVYRPATSTVVYTWAKKRRGGYKMSHIAGYEFFSESISWFWSIWKHSPAGVTRQRNWSAETSPLERLNNRDIIFTRWEYNF